MDGDEAQQDIFIAGFTCKPFSQEATTRFKTADVSMLFQSKSEAVAA